MALIVGSKKARAAILKIAALDFKLLRIDLLIGYLCHTGARNCGYIFTCKNQAQHW